MDRPVRYSKTFFWSLSIAGVSVLLGFQGTLYRLEEVLVCWLLFALAFAVMAMVAAIGVAIYFATLGLFRLITGAVRAILHVRLTTPTLHPK